MSDLYRSRITSESNKPNQKSIIPLFILLTLYLIVQPTEANDGDETTVSAWTRSYQFLADISTITQTGGIAGIHRTYTITGTFRLMADFDADTASFDIVDASAVYSIPSRTGKTVRYSIDPNEIFNMTELDGIIVDGNSILFEGIADDGSSVQITLTLGDDNISLQGETIPPPDSADFFIYALDALVEPKYEYGGGSGTSDDPYRIYTAEQMNAIGANPIDWNNHFKLMADINLSEFDGREGRSAFNVIGTSLDSSFTGVFDGNDHEIFNFSHTSPYMFYIECVGLFGIVNDPNAEIRNLGLINPRVVDRLAKYIGSVVGCLEHGSLTHCYTRGGSAEGWSWAGYVSGLVGYNLGGAITNCHSTSTILGGGASAGGLVGNNSGTIINCYSNSTVYGTFDVGGLVGSNTGTIRESYSSSVVSGGIGSIGIGGLVGFNGRGNIATSYSTGAVSGDRVVGGLVGDNGSTGSITMSYSAGLVRGNEFVGGLLGRVRGSSNYVTSCFWDEENTGQATSAGGTGKTTSEMQMASTFLEAGWDFVDEVENGTEDVWKITDHRQSRWYEEGP